MSDERWSLKQLAKAFKGYVITGEISEPDEDGFSKIYLMDRNTGETYHIEPSRDAEGNGPGFLFFGEGK